MSAIRFHAAVRTGVALATLLGMMVGMVAAQPAVPVAPQPTLFSFLGIPQGLKRLSGNMINRRGNFPGLEPKPPLKALADPANLLSKNPAIKAAAEIKMEENLAKQKIKAIKYLAEVGCGCYPGVKEALMAAMDDCTPKVKLAAIEAVGRASQTNCEHCNKNCCCDEDMVKKLAEIAYEKDDKGCWLEPSEETREAAKEAIRACCPGRGPPPDVVPVDGGETVPRTPIQGGETVPLPPGEPPPPPIDKPKEARRGKAGEAFAFAADDLGSAGNLVVTDGDSTTRLILPEHAGSVPQSRIAEPDAAPFRTVSTSPRRLDMDQLSSITEPAPGASPVVSGPAVMRQPTSIVAVPVTIDQITSAWVDGTVRGTDPKSGTATLLFPGAHRPMPGSRVTVHHDYLLGTERNGELQIVRHQGRETIARPLGKTSLAKIAVGDEVRFEVSESNKFERQIPAPKQTARPTVRQPARIAAKPTAPQADKTTLAQPRKTKPSTAKPATAQAAGAKTPTIKPIARPVIKASAEKPAVEKPAAVKKPSSKFRPETLWLEG